MVGGEPLNPKGCDHLLISRFEQGPFLIPGNTFILGESFEGFRMPPDVIGLGFGKSSYARCGVITNICPIDAGWNGILTICIVNTSPLPVWLYPSEGIAQIVFFRGEGFGGGYDGSYQNASGVEASRLLEQR